VSVDSVFATASRADSSSVMLCSTTRALAPPARTVAAADSSTTLTTTDPVRWSSHMPAELSPTLSDSRSPVAIMPGCAASCRIASAVLSPSSDAAAARATGSP